MSHPLHEVVIDTDLVTRLLAVQHPDLAGLPLQVANRGWDNVTVRIGDDLAARLPARALAAPLIRHEQRWLPVIARLLPVAVPVPVRHGTPDAGYPWSWSVVPWLVGTPADTVAPPARDPWAADLGAALAALHVPAPSQAPANPFRGVRVAARDDAVRRRLADLEEPTARVLGGLWTDGLTAPPWDRAPVWLHGDPHPANLLTGDTGLVAMLDFGDLTAGDPASDLATAWLCFGAGARERFWATYAERSPVAGAELDALRRRARAWAAALVPVLAAHPDEHPGLAAVAGHATDQLRGEG